MDEGVRTDPLAVSVERRALPRPPPCATAAAASPNEEEALLTKAIAISEGLCAVTAAGRLRATASVLMLAENGDHNGKHTNAAAVAGFHGRGAGESYRSHG